MAMFEGVRNFWREFRESFRDQEIGLEVCPFDFIRETEALTYLFLEGP